jgi:uncharacterized membrane protein YadS
MGATGSDRVLASGPIGAKALWLKEDWWAIWIGLAVVLIAIVLFLNGSTVLKSLAVNPGGVKWVTVGQLADHFAANAGKYAVQFVVFAAVFGVSCAIMGINLGRFLVGFLFLYLLSVCMFAIGGWANAARYNLEPPLVALVVGLLLANTVPLPKILDDAFRVEYYVKLGIVLLGATFPITLVLTAGPVAIGQATIISLLTAFVIYFLGTRVFGLDRRLGAVLSVGGAVCGVSASMAIAASVGAKREHVYTSVTLVVVWALIMIGVLPFVSKAMGLSAGVAGAWIGTSEFADAAGFAAASTYGKMAGNEEVSIRAFTLMKVIGRDLWIGIWSLVWALVATTQWEKLETGTRPSVQEVWRRFPKFVIGFFVASIIVTLFTQGYDAATLKKVVKPAVMDQMGALRGWAFIFCFLSIGLTTRFRELSAVSRGALLAFSAGVVVNVVAGWVLSAQVFGDYWSAL